MRLSVQPNIPKSITETYSGTSEILIDGTFRSCPKYLYQFFTYHGLVIKPYISLVFFLLLDKKTEHTYLRLVEHTVNSCARYQLKFSPNILSIDFEITIYKAANMFCAKIKILVCRFRVGKN